MMRVGLCLVFALGVAGASAASAPAQPGAAQPAPAAAASRPRWEVNWGDNQCMLIRHSGGGSTKSFALRRVPGAGPTDLVTIDPAPSQAAPAGRRELDIVLTPSGERLSGSVMRTGRTASGNTVIEIVGDEELLDQFAASTALEVSAGGRSYFQMSYPLPTSGLAALRECENNALRGWGIDPALLDSVRRRPRMLNRVTITSQDYPVGAVQANRQGVALIRLTVNVQGLVDDCGVVATSGTDVLDQQSCVLMQRRGRFRPALGADGQPMRSILRPSRDLALARRLIVHGKGCAGRS